MRFNKFILAFCLWFTVYAQGGHNNDAAQPAAIDNISPRAVANANAATARAAYAAIYRRANATQPKGNGTNHGNKDSVKVKCAEISSLTELADLVNNSTKLAEFQAKHNLTTAEMQKLKNMAANATAQLTQLKSNTTLVKECATMQAAENLKAQCKEMQQLTNLAKLANNATELQDLQKKYNLTASQVQKIKNEAANATAKLNALQRNSTLIADCQNLKTNHTNNGTSTATGSATVAKSTTSKAIRSVNSASGSSVLTDGMFAVLLSGLAIMLML